MRNEHEGKYENVYYMNPKDNIMYALAMSDLVISEESSVMTEALMFLVPSIGVRDWADVDLPYEYVYRDYEFGRILYPRGGKRAI